MPCRKHVTLRAKPKSLLAFSALRNPGTGKKVKPGKGANGSFRKQLPTYAVKFCLLGQSDTIQRIALKRQPVYLSWQEQILRKSEVEQHTSSTSYPMWMQANSP